MLWYVVTLADVILIWKFNLLAIEPGIPRSRAGINNHVATDACIKTPPWMHVSSVDTCIRAGAVIKPALDRGIPGSIPGR